MGWANKIIGWATGNGAEVDANHRVLVNLADASTQADQVGSVRMYGIDEHYPLEGIDRTYP